MATPGNESILIYASSSMYFTGVDTESSLTRLENRTIQAGGRGGDSARSFMRFSMPRLPKNSIISSASLNITFSNTEVTATNFKILEYPPSAQALTYNVSYWSCINGLATPMCVFPYSWDGGLDTSGASGTIENMGSNNPLFLPPTSATAKSMFITDLVNYYNTNRQSLGLTLELMLKRNIESNANMRNIHSAHAVSGYLPSITYDYDLPSLSSNLTSTINSIGRGVIATRKNANDNLLLSIKSISGSRALSDPTFVNGMPIMTSDYGKHKAIHVYEISDIGSESEMRTTWNGMPIQLVAYGNATDYALLSDIEDSEYEPSDNDIDKTFLIGNLHINLDNEYKLLVYEKTGEPLETHYIFIGGNPVRIGRFADGWAIGIAY